MSSKTIIFKSTRRNQWSFLSNFWPHVYSPELVAEAFNVRSDDHLMLRFRISSSFKKRRFKTSEHFYQYVKFKVIDPKYAELIYNADTSLEAKQLSGKGTYINSWWKNSSKKRGTKKKKQEKFDRLHERFHDRYRDLAMLYALLMKFSRSGSLKRALFASGERILQEQGRFKSYWAVPGDNALGRMLMVVRQYLRELEGRKSVWRHLSTIFEMYSGNTIPEEEIKKLFRDLLGEE